MENEKLKRYALVAEIVSAAAVVVSLVFVAFQVKDNTAAIRSAAYDGISSDHSEWRMTVATNPELTAAMIKSENLMLKTEDSDIDISDVERRSADRAFEALWQIYERAYFARRYGTLGDSEWARYEKAICRIAALIDVEDVLGRYLTTEFKDFANSCSQSNGS